ncbi:hypothetical protein [Curtobacterium sp. P97]|uniref:hypothetical protein n=1 Tax=Curtobacterium sp. P97 TaxID=2939562 RepID=UPI00204007A6|nr:hypothetical protein [Curtobacterium sp. P97]MCM3520988.1 hypothetical protein [Curtobacterium sp. P97]
MPNTEEFAITALAEALPNGSVVLSPRRDGSWTATLPDGSRRRLVVSWAGYGYPRDVQRALIDPEVRAAREHGDLIVIAAHTVSPGARQLLRSEGASWVGRDGSAELRLGTVWIDRDRASPSRPADRPLTWSPARADVTEALLAVLTERDPATAGASDVPDVEMVARLSGRSLGTVAGTYALLDAQQWTAPGFRPRSRVVANGPAMFDSWSRWAGEQRRRFDGFHSVHRDPARIVEQLGEAFGDELVLTGAAASELSRPTLTGGWVVTAYVASPDAWRGIDEATRRARLIPASVPRIRLAPTTPVIERTASIVDGRRVAAPARVYADLAAGTDREREAAESFRATMLQVLS